MDLDDDELDDNDFEGDYEAKSKKQRELEERKKGPIVALGPEFCRASGGRCRHFAHEKCIEAHRRNGNASCPRCYDLKSRIHGKLPHNVYCKGISTHIDDPNKGGFTASAKIEEAIKWFQTTVPKDDKAIILSFFKGSLDLIEGILVSKFGIDCARYDGDVSKEARTMDLERFKTSGTCRVLLATVQSGGTGLNITEANHICFLDRWFNPCVHDQAESRCHRIGQKKNVNIAYLDINCTVDIVMKRINVLKEGNASVILADGTSLGDRWSLGYTNVSGVIGNTLNALRDMREETTRSNGDAPLPPYVESDLEKKLESMKPKAKLPIQQEEKENKFKPEAGVLPVQSSFLHRLNSIKRTDLNNLLSRDDKKCPNVSSLKNVGLTRIIPTWSKLPAVARAATASRPIIGHNATITNYNPRKPTHTSSASTRRSPITLSTATHASLKRNIISQRKTNRFSRGLSAIVSQKRRTKEVMRRKQRGDL